MKFIDVESSNLKAVSYNTETEELFVKFKNESVYKYDEVSAEEFCLLLFAESIGSYFNKSFRKHKFTKI